MSEIEAVVRHLARAEAPGGAVLATLVSVEGSSYRRPGARLLLAADGARIGGVSGGCLEEDVIERAKAVAATGRPEVVVYDTTAENDLLWGVGLGCHGVVRVVIERLPPRPEWAVRLDANLRAGLPSVLAVAWRVSEPGTRWAGAGADLPGGEDAFLDRIEPPPRLSIFGAGDDARPLARLSKGLGWHVTVADPRPALASALRFPEADALLTAPAGELVPAVGPSPGSLAVVMTHHYAHDLPILRGLLGLQLGFLGLLGPRRRAEKMLADLASSGLEVTPAMRTRLHAPVGLDIGAEGPDEVALSIVAEMRAALAGRDGRPLRERALPIHGESRPAP